MSVARRHARDRTSAGQRSDVERVAAEVVEAGVAARLGGRQVAVRAFASRLARRHRRRRQLPDASRRTAARPRCRARRRRGCRASSRRTCRRSRASRRRNRRRVRPRRACATRRAWRSARAVRGSRPRRSRRAVPPRASRRRARAAPARAPRATAARRPRRAPARSSPAARCGRGSGSARSRPRRPPAAEARGASRRCRTGCRRVPCSSPGRGTTTRKMGASAPMPKPRRRSPSVRRAWQGSPAQSASDGSGDGNRAVDQAFGWKPRSSRVCGERIAGLAGAAADSPSIASSDAFA